MRRNTYLNCWATIESRLRFCTPALFMGGWLQTSTHDVTTRNPRSPCLKSKTQGTASAATPTLSGYLIGLVSLLVIVVRCCSTCLAKGTSQTKEQAMRYTVTAIGGLGLKEMATLSYVQCMNHLMVIISAIHMQISLVIVSQLMVLVETCSLTTRMDDSQ